MIWIHENELTFGLSDILTKIFAKEKRIQQTAVLKIQTVAS